MVTQADNDLSSHVRCGYIYDFCELMYTTMRSEVADKVSAQPQLGRLSDILINEVYYNIRDNILPHTLIQIDE